MVNGIHQYEKEQIHKNNAYTKHQCVTANLKYLYVNQSIETFNWLPSITTNRRQKIRFDETKN